MRIETTRFGPLDLEESVFIHFPWGIPGFEEHKHYVLLEHGHGPFKWLQATDEPDVAFLVCPPEVMGAAYQVPKEKGSAIGLEHPEDLVVLIMVSFDSQKKSIHPYLQGPLIFNASNRLASQWTMDSREVLKYIQKSLSQ